jgi:DNA mismatch repair protein MutS
MPSSRPPETRTLALPGLEDAGLSPIRRQYLELKRQRPDAILLFRLGDFYEAFEDDAHLVARVLDITLTSREMGRGERLPMAGIPAHAAESYIARLIAQGHYVAIAEQVGTLARNGLVPREIVRVLTPGTLLESELLTGSRGNFLLAVHADNGAYGLAYVDVSTGECAATELRGHDTADLLGAELTRVGPAECLVCQGQEEQLANALPPGTVTTIRGADVFAPHAASRALVRAFGGAPEAGGLTDYPLALRAVGALLAYVHESRPGATASLQFPRVYDVAGAMVLDRATRRNLDVLESVAGEDRPTLIGVLNRSATAMGARLLRGYLGRPLLDVGQIEQRLDGVERLVRDSALRARLLDALRGLPDLERLAVRAGQRLLAPRECLALATGLERIPDAQRALSTAGELPVILAAAVPAGAPEAAADVRATLRAGATVFEEGVIRPGVSAELDQHRALAGDARQWIAALEQRERERTGVRGAKVGYNKVFGYYLEVSAAQCGQATDYYQRETTGAGNVGEHLEKLGWVRKQTLANAERFVTHELKEMEARVAGAHEDAIQLERELYNALLGRLAEQAPRIADTARAVAVLDVLSALADGAATYGYVRPVVDQSDCLEIVEGRHPVVERSLPAGRFVPNDTRLGSDERMMLLTGPNMAGKSTYLRQVALIVLMAQAGSFVSASSARIGVLDRILTRIGAHDDIAAGRSTFMVEMIEAATIVRSATARSLVVLDEVGRGTSTFDGMAIAQAILEELHDEERPAGAPKTVFATHYHELTALADSLPRLRTYRVDVLERGDDVVFLHTVVAGGADKSYGVHVARLAGVPERVTRRAAELLEALESRRLASPSGRGSG